MSPDPQPWRPPADRQPPLSLDDEAASRWTARVAPIVPRGRFGSDPAPLPLGGSGRETEVIEPAGGSVDPVDVRPAPRSRVSLGVGTQALLAALVGRVALAGIVWLSLRVFPRFAPYPGQLPDTFFPTHPALDGWARWDAAHYVAIAGQGYGGSNPSPHGGAGFFPLFPLLMRGMVATSGWEATPAHLALAGVILANVCFLLAMPLLARFGARQSTPAVGRTAAFVLGAAPFAFFFNAGYSESLFLLLALLALSLANKRRWWWAGLAAGLASGTRLVGLALTPALLLLVFRRGERGADLMAVGLLAPSGTLAFAAYTGIAFGDPLAYLHAQGTWGGWQEHVRFYAELFWRQPREALATEPRHLFIMLNLAVALVSVLLLPLVWRRFDPATALFTTLIVAQAGMTWVSLGRYLLPAVGVYLVAGQLLESSRLAGWARDGLLVASTLLLALLAVLYAHGYWVV